MEWASSEGQASREFFGFVFCFLSKHFGSPQQRMQVFLNWKEFVEGEWAIQDKQRQRRQLFLLSFYGSPFPTTKSRFLLENICHCSALMVSTFACLFFNRLTCRFLRMYSRVQASLPHQEFCGLVVISLRHFLDDVMQSSYFLCPIPSVRNSFSRSSKALLTQEASTACLSRIIYSAGSEPCPPDFLRALTTSDLACVGL